MSLIIGEMQNQSNSEISHARKTGIPQRTIRAGADVRRKKLSFTTGGNAKWSSLSGKQYEHFFKKLVIGVGEIG